MWLRRHSVLALVVIACSYAAAKPTTQDTLVVSRSEDETGTPAMSSEATTDDPSAPIKLTEMDVQSKISLRYAHTAVVTRVRNPAKRAQETTFRMLLPDTAFISGFTMTIDGKAYKAYVKEKEEAKRVYNEAVSQGMGAAHIAAKARDSNHFTVSVNVEPRSTVVFNLTYEELLVRRNGVYNHAVNLHPGALVPKMKVTVHIKESEKIVALRVPEIRTGNEIDASEDDPQNSNAVIKRTHDDREATITFTPDIDEQKRLIQVYAEKSRQSLGSSHRFYPEDSEENDDKEGVLGQFVVQYDVDRSKSGEILVNDGYFVHFFAPTSLPPLPKYVVFVLDTSGSMMGRKIVQLREAMQTILSKLNIADFFSIVEFNSYVKVHELSEADKVETSTRRHFFFEMSPERTNLVAPSQATPENIAKAKTIVSRLEAGGGTNIASALDTGVDLIQKGSVWNTAANEANPSEAKPEEGSENKTTKDSNKREPIIIFLTDGDPTVGETDPTRIANRLTEKNVGENRASIYSLAFGDDADRKLMRKISLSNEGFMRHIYEAADAALQLRDFYRTISSPLLADVKFLYPKAQIKEGSLTKHAFRTYFAGSETVVAGRVNDDATELQPQVLGFCGMHDGVGRKRYEISPKVPVARSSVHYYPLERLWAYLTIKQLLDEKDAYIDSKNEKDKENKDKLEKRALEIALTHEFVTPLTSLVVVKPNATKAVNAESVDDRPISLSFQSLSPKFHVGSRPAANMYTLRLQSPAPIFALGASRPQMLNYHSLAAPQHAMSYMPQDLGLTSISSGSYPESISLNYEAHEEEEDDTDSDRLFGGGGSVNDRIVGGYVSHSDLADIRFSSYSTVPSTTINPLQRYSLKQYPWTLPLLNTDTDSLEMYVNGTQISLKLSKDGAEAPVSNATECSNAPAGGEGQCVYLTRCDAARAINITLYRTSYCVVDNGYAGVCCPKSKDDATSP